MEAASDDLLRLAAAARELHVPLSWLRQEIESDRLPCLRCGSRVLVHLPTLQRMLLAIARGETQGTEAQP